jgi:hypothetical protein
MFFDAVGLIVSSEDDMKFMFPQFFSQGMISSDVTKCKYLNRDF